MGLSKGLRVSNSWQNFSSLIVVNAQGLQEGLFGAVRGADVSGFC